MRNFILSTAIAIAVLIGCAPAMSTPVVLERASHDVEVMTFATVEEMRDFLITVMGIEYVVIDPTEEGAPELEGNWGKRFPTDEQIVEKGTRIINEMLRLMAEFPGLDFSHINVLFVTNNEIGIASVPSKGAQTIWMSIMDELDDEHRAMWEDYRGDRDWETQPSGEASR